MDIFKKMGITVGHNTPLIQESISKSEQDQEIVHNNIIRKGAGLSPRDILEQQISKGGVVIRPMTDDEMSDEDDKAKAKAVNPHLKGTHGEEFHSDNDKQVEKMVTEGEVIQSEFDHEKPMKVEFKSMSVLDALSDIVKSDKKVSNKISKLVNEGKPQKQAVAIALDMERRGELDKKAYKSDVKIPKKDFVQEHKKLVNVLESPSHRDDKKEAKEQEKELKEMDKAGYSCKSMNEAMDALDDIIKGGKLLSTRVPKHAPKPEKSKYEMRVERQLLREQMGKAEMPEGVSKKEFNKIANLHENSEGVAEKKKSVVPFLKSVGPGGLIFDFGSKTGNPMADNATALLNQNADPVQQANANYNATSYSKALEAYVTKGEQAYMTEATPYGNVDKEWSKQLNTPMDEQVKEAFEKGQFSEDNSKPAIINDFNKTEMNLGGQVIKATSETDAALIEMMRGSLVQDDGTGIIAEIGGGEGRVAEIS
jgi:hypothetical protein